MTELPGTSTPLFRRMQVVPFVLITLIIVFFLYQIVAGGITLLLAGGAITASTVQWVRWSTLIGQLLFILFLGRYLKRCGEIQEGESQDGKENENNSP